MKTHIVRIGNSRGVRLPKTLLQEAQLEGEVELQAEPGRILISKPSQPRAGWADAARRMREQDEDRLIDQPIPTRFDTDDWKWR
ncbi:MAG: AbrB/MazE/SpoVT family DNA-binding domain-containing protein [Nitrospira sp.]|nr:AbrB/MazE/SpoVT family DNA-binding domain-containing protein [Nitrospira sp.]MBK9948210.1 AbrB/MazE/SpoVT family DNA-binding domain-containing protein [Nitrospira sp.]